MLRLCGAHLEIINFFQTPVCSLWAFPEQVAASSEEAAEDTPPCRFCLGVQRKWSDEALGKWWEIGRQGLRPRHHDLPQRGLGWLWMDYSQPGKTESRTNTCTLFRPISRGWVGNQSKYSSLSIPGSQLVTPAMTHRGPAARKVGPVSGRGLKIHFSFSQFRNEVHGGEHSLIIHD